MIRLLFFFFFLNFCGETQTGFRTHYFYFERAASSGSFEIWNLLLRGIEIGVTVQKKIAWIAWTCIHCGVELKNIFYIAGTKSVNVRMALKPSCCFLRRAWSRCLADFLQHGSVRNFFFFFNLFEAGVFLRTDRRLSIAAICRRSFRLPDVDLNQMKSSWKCQRCVVLRRV